MKYIDPRSKMSIDELKEAIKERKERIAELEAQDETNFDEFDKCVKGKEVNIKLCNNHIKYYQDELDKRNKSSLRAFI